MRSHRFGNVFVQFGLACFDYFHIFSVFLHQSMRLAASLFYILVLLFYLCTDLLYCLVSRAFILVQKKNCNLIASIKLFISFILYVYIRMHFVTCSVKASKSSCTWQTFTDSPNGFSKVFFVIFFSEKRQYNFTSDKWFYSVKFN